jgi:hypothetical protein
MIYSDASSANSTGTITCKLTRFDRFSDLKLFLSMRIRISPNFLSASGLEPYLLYTIKKTLKAFSLVHF